MNDFSNWIMNEMPINKFQLVGDWGPKSKLHGWDRPSTKILTNQRGVEKIQNKWSNTEVDFDMYFVRKSGAKEHLETGEVDPSWIKENLDINFEHNPDVVTIFFTQNVGNQKIPMTAWVIGHRMGHAFRASRRHDNNSYTGQAYEEMTNIIRNEMIEVLSLAYGEKVPSQRAWGDDWRSYSAGQKKLQLLSQAIGTMRSARNGKIRDFGEFIHELFGQYILTGGVKFVKDVPKSIGKRYNWGREQPIHSMKHDVQNDEIMLKELQYKLRSMEDIIDQQCSMVLHSAIGKVFVM